MNINELKNELVQLNCYDSNNGYLPQLTNSFFFSKNFFNSVEQKKTFRIWSDSFKSDQN